MRKARTRVWSIFMAVIMLLTMIPLPAFAVEGTDETTVSVDSFEDLQSAASTAAEGSVVAVSGEIEMEEAVTFENKITLKLTETAAITYASEENQKDFYLITLKDGSTLDMAAGATVTMTGYEPQTSDRDWRAVYSNGDLTVTQFEGSISVTNARGRGLYAKNDLVFQCPMNGQVIMDNYQGDNQYLYGIVSYAGDVIFEQGIGEESV